MICINCIFFTHYIMHINLSENGNTVNLKIKWSENYTLH